MKTKSINALEYAELALEALDAACDADESINQNKRIGKAIKALQSALEVLGKEGPAMKAARLLVEAYAMADEDNGGSASVDWDGVDEAHLAALDALGGVDGAAAREINEWAKGENGA